MSRSLGMCAAAAHSTLKLVVIEGHGVCGRAAAAAHLVLESVGIGERGVRSSACVIVVWCRSGVVGAAAEVVGSEVVVGVVVVVAEVPTG